MSNFAAPFITLPTRLVNLVAGKPTVLFKAVDRDYTVTVEMKNLNENDVNLSAVVLGADNVPLIDTPIEASIREQKSFKKANVFVPKGESVIVKSNTPGFAARVYQPLIYAVPGQVRLNKNTEMEVKIYLNSQTPAEIIPVSIVPGVEAIPVQPMSNIDTPAVFKVTRTDTEATGQIQFTTGGSSNTLGTVIDVQYGEPLPPVDDGCPADNFDADLAAAYINSRDHTVTGT